MEDTNIDLRSLGIQWGLRALGVTREDVVRKVMQGYVIERMPYFRGVVFTSFPFLLVILLLTVSYYYDLSYSSTSYKWAMMMVLIFSAIAPFLVKYINKRVMGMLQSREDEQP